MSQLLNFGFRAGAGPADPRPVHGAPDGGASRIAGRKAGGLGGARQSERVRLKKLM